jgi:hypothetical protein
MTSNSVHFGSDLVEWCQTQRDNITKICGGLALIGGQMLLGHPNITHWTNMDDMK